MGSAVMVTGRPSALPTTLCAKPASTSHRRPLHLHPPAVHGPSGHPQEAQAQHLDAARWLRAVGDARSPLSPSPRTAASEPGARRPGSAFPASFSVPGYTYKSGGRFPPRPRQGDAVMVQDSPEAGPLPTTHAPQPGRRAGSLPGAAPLPLGRSHAAGSAGVGSAGPESCSHGPEEGDTLRRSPKRRPRPATAARIAGPAGLPPLDLPPLDRVLVADSPQGGGQRSSDALGTCSWPPLTDSRARVARSPC